MINNYLSHLSPGAGGQVFLFFDDTNPVAERNARGFALAQEGCSVFRRPWGREWRTVPQIRGNYSREWPKVTR